MPHYRLLYKPETRTIASRIHALAFVYGVELFSQERDTSIWPLYVGKQKCGIWAIGLPVEEFLESWQNVNDPILWAIGLTGIGMLLFEDLRAKDTK